MLTVVFGTQYGAETLVTSAPFTVKNSPTVHLLLWGPKWGTGAGQSDPAPVINQAKAVLNSTYFKGLTEYGSDGLIGTVDSYVDTANAVPADFNPGLLTGNSLTEAQSELTTVINANHLPGPGNPASVAAAPIYLIITDPTHSNGTNGGYNNSGTVATKSVNIASVGTDANFQLFGDTFSHEMAETISDPSSGGVVLDEPSTIPSTLLNDPTKAYNNSVNQIQIADGEAEPAGQAHYTYRLGTAEVQPFWSNSFSAFIVPDGNTQRFSLAPIWNTSTVTFSNAYNLTINGDQLANKNDTIIISRDAAGGTRINLNGEIANFDPVTTTFQGTPLQSITVVGGAGNDSVTVDFTNGNPLPATGLNFSGGAGTNQISATGDTSFTLTNSNLVNGFGATITFSAVQVANLTGGSHSNAFDVSSWTGSGQIDGQGSDDVLLVTKNANFTASGSVLAASDGLSMSLANLEQVNLTGGAGNNTFTVQSSSSVSINVSGGGGSDTVSLVGNTFPTINTHDASADISSGLSDTQVTFADIARLECHAGIGATTFNIDDLTSGPSVFCYGDAYSSVMNISTALVDAIGAQTYFYGGSGTDTLVVPPGSDPTGTNVTVAGSQVIHSAGGSLRSFIFDVNVDQISLSGGSGTNIFSVDDLAATNTVTINGSDGNDSVFLGLTDFDGSEPFSDAIKGNVVVHGGAGNNSLQVDDTAAIFGRTYELLNGTLKANGMSGLVTYDAMGSVALLGTAFGDIFNFDGSVATNLTVNGAGGDDVFSWNAANNVLPVMLIGGSGTDSLTVNDVNRSEFNYLMYPDEVNGYDPNSGDGEDFHYDQMESMTVIASADINQFTLFGTSSQITGQTTLKLGSGNDSVTVNVRDAAGNPTILSNLGILGGGDGDNLYLVDPATTGTTWTISNPFGASTQDFSVTGGALIGVASDVEGINIYGSSGDDTFNVNQYKVGSALGIAGGDGNDTVNVGNGNVAANITSISAFTFDGQAGFDSFNLDNSAEPNAWFYANSANSIQAQRVNPTAYIVNLGQVNTEHMTINAGPSTDSLTLVALASGEMLTFLGNDGNDFLSTNSPAAVQGPVYFYGGAGTGNAFNNSVNADTADRTVHLDQVSLGTYPGDNYFGPGGALYFYSLQSMVITMGSGRDTVYAQPNATATVNIRGGNPATVPGDTLNLALAGAVNYVVTPNPSLPTIGTVTSDNLQTLTYSGFETGPIVDDVAPSIIGQGYDDSGAVPAIFVQFNKDVSLALNVNYLELINTTTAVQVPPGAMAMTYDADTNTASFTFPGYAGGILPPGDYTAKILGTLPDAFGNPLGVETPFAFTVVDIAPAIVAQGYDDSGPVPMIFVQFSKDVSGALSVNDLDLINTTTAVQVSAGAMVMTYDAGTNTATFTVPGYTDGILPAGHYTAKINGAVTDSSGTPLGVETPFSFTVFSVPGDVNFDGIVNGQDIAVVASHWLNTGAGVPGDANNDDIVNGQDIAIVASHWLNTAPGGGPGLAASKSLDATASATVQPSQAHLSSFSTQPVTSIVAAAPPASGTVDNRARPSRADRAEDFRVPTLSAPLAIDGSRQQSAAQDWREHKARTLSAIDAAFSSIDDDTTNGIYLADSVAPVLSARSSAQMALIMAAPWQR